MPPVGSPVRRFKQPWVASAGAPLGPLGRPTPRAARSGTCSRVNQAAAPGRQNPPHSEWTASTSGRSVRLSMDGDGSTIFVDCAPDRTNRSYSRAQDRATASERWEHERRCEQQGGRGAASGHRQQRSHGDAQRLDRVESRGATPGSTRRGSCPGCGVRLGRAGGPQRIAGGGETSPLPSLRRGEGASHCTTRDIGERLTKQSTHPPLLARAVTTQARQGVGQGHDHDGPHPSALGGISCCPSSIAMNSSGFVETISEQF